MKDLAVVLGTETATIILDDTISVWPEHQHNLMQAGLSPHLAGRLKTRCNTCPASMAYDDTNAASRCNYECI